MANAMFSLQEGLGPTAQRRISRSPSHTWNLIHKPFTIQPFMIAPVLPGETMKNALIQARAVTDPLESSIIGWWLDYFLFYVKHADIDSSTNELQAMMLDPTAIPTTLLLTATDLKMYEQYDVLDTDQGVKWVSLCEQAVVEAWFRDEGESWTDHTVDGVPSAQHGQMSWLDSVINDAAHLVDDFNVDTDASTTVEASEVARGLAMWRLLNERGLTQMSYEEWLSTYGVQQPLEQVAGVPELLRSTREWVYPSNTIDPSSGAPTSACSWSIRERADKDRYFAQPGFIFGVTVARPKLYFSNQYKNAVSLMRDAYSWLPAASMNDPALRRRKVVAGDGPLNALTDDHWYDPGDLLKYGDQFRNYSASQDAVGLVALPTNGGDLKYPTEAMLDPLFVDNATPLEFVRQDGVCRLNIASHIRDVTPTSITP